jgi:selenocysteine-specific elongation factor
VHVLATAGHVDHGKSTLVRALTGIDPDRFAEEKARGLTIDLGFAWATLPSGREVAFVDVPGHVRFVRNMLAGTGSVDGCLFVVSAVEGFRQQSEEHLRILELLGVAHGVVALSMSALADDETRELAHLELADRLAGSFLEAAPVVETDVPAGIGLAGLVAALDDLTAVAPEAPDVGRPRLWIDRSFTMKGSGTVVTGTLTGGRIAVSDRLEAVPGPPPGDRPIPVRVRSIQRHLETLSIASPGRLALNLVGVPHEALQRGQALVRPGQWEPTRTLDASLRVLGGLAHEVERRGSYQAHFGSGHQRVSLRVLGAGSILPGEAGLVRMHLTRRLPLLPGDRYVLREDGRGETVGGGEVLDVAPVVPARRARPDRSVERVVGERGFVEVELLERLTGVVRPADLAGRWACDPGARRREEERLAEAVEAAGPGGLDVAPLSELERALLEELGGVAVAGGRAMSAEHAGTDRLADHPYLAELAVSLFSPPSPDEAGVDRGELRELVRRGLVVESSGIYFSAEAITKASDVLRRLLAEEPEGVSASRVREALGTSRKYVLPLLAHLDANGLTRRRGDLRLAGPRLPDGATVSCR